MPVSVSMGGSSSLKGSAMLKNPEPFVEGKFLDLFDAMPRPETFVGSSSDWTRFGLKQLEGIGAYFSEEQKSECCQIPAADLYDAKLLIGNRELMVRFASMPIAAQAQLLSAIRGSMEKHATKRLRLELRWSISGSNKKVLEVQLENDGKTLRMNVSGGY
jgi:hypothetical protein